MSESFVAGEEAGGEGAAGAPLPYLPPPEAEPHLCSSLHCPPPVEQETLHLPLIKEIRLCGAPLQPLPMQG